MTNPVTGVGVAWTMALCVAAATAAEPADPVLIRGDLRVRVSAGTGDITSIKYRGRDMLSAPATLVLKVLDEQGRNPVALRPGKVTDFKATVDKVQYVRLWSTGARTAVTFTIDEYGIYWSVTATGPAPVRQLTVDYNIPCLAGMEQVFWPEAGAPYDAADEPAGFLYPSTSVLPLLTVYREAADVGFTAVAPLELRKPSLRVQLDWPTGTLRFSYRHLRLGGPWRARTGLRLFGHAGCWRPALAWMLRRYPDYFASHPRVLAGEGLFEGSWLRHEKLSTPAERNKRWRRFGGLGWVESHSFWPFMGLYVPDKDPWIAIMPPDRKKAAHLTVWEQGKEKGRSLSRQWVRDYIRAYHKLGIQYYAYVNTNEAWLHYANKYFPDSIVWRNPSPYYGGMAGMNAWETTSWGKHIREQVRRTVECFPEQDGLFLDQNCHRGWHFGADDGVSMARGKLCSQISFSQEQMIASMHKLTAPHNMGIWTNYASVGVECTRYIHGIMSEAGRPRAQNLQYLCLARPLVVCNNDRTASLNEERFKICLSCAAFPPARWDGAEATQRIVRRYLPLLDRLKGRRWALNARALRLPPGLEGNIFRVPNGDHVVTFITPNGTQLEPARTPFMHQLPVAVRLPTGSVVNSAYLLSGDYDGSIELELKRTGQDVELTVPAHLASSMIVLTDQTPPAVTRLTSPALDQGRQNQVRFRIRGVKAKTVRLTSPWGTHKAKAKPEAGRACTASFTVSVPSDAPAKEVELKLSIDGVDVAGQRLSAWVERSADMTCPQAVFVKKRSAILRAHVVNHRNEPAELFLAARPVGIIMAPASVRLRPYERREVEMSVRASKGDCLVHLTATLAGRPIFEGATTVSVPRAPRPDDLFHQPFAADMSGWKVRQGQWACMQGVATANGSAHLAVLDRPKWRDYGIQYRTQMDGSATKPWIKSYLFLRMDNKGSFARFGFTGQCREAKDFTRVALDRCIQGRYAGTIKEGRFPYRPGRWYVVRVEVAGRRLRGYVDNVLIVDTPLPDDVPEAGGIGLGVPEDHMTNHYRDLIVYPLHAK
jgi:hypothetical protein